MTNRAPLATLLALLAASSHASGESPQERAQRLIAAGRPQEASTSIRSLLERSPPAGSEAASLLLVLAHAEVNVGRYESALEAAREALAIYTQIGDRAGSAHAHARIAAASDELGRYDESHLHNDRALDLYRQLGDRAGEARCLSLFGTSHRFLGDPRPALDFHERAAAIFVEQGLRRHASLELRSIGLVLEDLGRPADAERRYRQGLDLLDERDGPWVLSDASFHLGRLLARTGRGREAAPILDRALRLARTSGNRWAEARTLVELARIEGQRGDPLRAADLARAGADLLADMGARDLEWEAIAVAGSLRERGGDLAGACRAFELAARVLEPIRASIGPPLLRTRYTPKSQWVYESLVRVHARWPPDLDDATRARRTLEAAERNRARTFAEMLLDAEFAATAPVGHAARELRARMHALRTRTIELPAGAAVRESLERELLDAERRWAAARSARRRGDPRGVRVNAGEPVHVVEIAREIVGRTNVLAYLLGDETSFGWYLDRSGTTLFELPPRAEIENLVLLYRGLLLSAGDPQASRRVGELLAERLLGPFADAVASTRALTIVPDGALFHLPFEALPVPGGAGELLVERRAVGYAPSLLVLESLHRRARQHDARGAEALIVFGVPHAAAPFPPLVHAATEARSVASLVPARLRVERVGGAATEGAFRALVAQPSRIVHVATHAVLDDVRPERSGLAFAAEDGRDGFLDLYELLDLRIPTELVVLSGCETGRGRLLRGEGVLGLSRAFLFAGSRSVLASLWRVDDRSTEEFMVRFYRALGRGRSAAEALREAKRRSIESGDPPCSWAAFVLVGDGATRIDLPAPPRVVLGRVLVGAGLALSSLALLARWGTGRRRGLPGGRGASSRRPVA